MPWARRLLPLAWYTLLAVAFTWPLAFDLHADPCRVSARGTSPRCTAPAIPT